MLINASIPVEMIKGPFTTSFRHELQEVEVLRVVRCPATRYPNLNRWHYEADIADHPKMCAGAIRIGMGGAFRVRIDRWLNPRWKPPVFPDGANSVEIKEGGTA